MKEKLDTEQKKIKIRKAKCPEKISPEVWKQENERKSASSPSPRKVSTELGRTKEGKLSLP